MTSGETLATASVRRTVELAARQSYGKLLAFLAARTRDVSQAEDALADAFASALATWPVDGVPRSPEAWLLAAAKRKGIDAARRRRTRTEAADTLRLLTEIESAPEDAAGLRRRRNRLRLPRRADGNEPKAGPRQAEDSRCRDSVPCSREARSEGTARDSAGRNLCGLCGGLERSDGNGLARPRSVGGSDLARAPRRQLAAGRTGSARPAGADAACRGARRRAPRL